MNIKDLENIINVDLSGEVKYSKKFLEETRAEEKDWYYRAAISDFINSCILMMSCNDGEMPIDDILKMIEGKRI